MKNISLFIFVISSLATLVAQVGDLQLLNMIAKPLIMASLFSFYFFSLDKERSTTLMLAIVLSMAGDVFLLFPNYFIPGLVSFLIAHIFYIFAYRQHTFEE